MVYIYALVSGQLILYIGKTKNIKKRENEHRSKGNDCTSKNIPEYIDWEIKLLEEVPEDQGITKEQYYYDTLKPLYNKCRPGQSMKEYNQSEARKEAYRRYRQSEANRRYQQSEARKEAQRKYYLKKKSEAPVENGT